MTLPTTSERLVVIGGGQAAAQLIEVARQEGFAGAITLVSDEPMVPYQRPPLSKTFLTNDRPVEWLHYRSLAKYASVGVTLLLGREVVAIDRKQAAVLLEDGTLVPYDKLALATGSRATRLEAPGADDDRLFYIRTFKDVERLKARLKVSRRILIVGGGFIGLEAAATLASRHEEVTLLAAYERLIPRVLTEPLSRFLLGRHLARGVSIHLNARVASMKAVSASSTYVSCSDGREFVADAVIVGIGAQPNVELAQAAGLECDNGIVVDESTRTSDPAIFAVGDCTSHPNRALGRRLRLETVHNAVEQGRTAGFAMAGGSHRYDQTPWVWSDQFDLRIQSVGIATGFDREIIRGDPDSGQFSALYYRDDALIAANTINQPLVFGAVRKILNGGLRLEPCDAADMNFDIRSHARTAAKAEFDIPWPKRWEKGRSALDWGHA
jgi:3-phenylpropionate/trans-cinnamate dioxygenase ferredoxin reductase subunit